MNFNQKIQLKVGNMLNPTPVVMVSCGETPDEYNIITVAWTGTLCSDPPMCYISVRPERHSYAILKERKQFVINLVNEPLAAATDWCGVRSGKKYNKFFETNLTPIRGNVVKAPMIYESPVNLECEVTDIVSLGSHNMLAENITIKRIIGSCGGHALNPNTGSMQQNSIQMAVFATYIYTKFCNIYYFTHNKKIMSDTATQCLWPSV